MIADGDSTYFLKPLEYHFAIFHTLSSLERESHPSLRLNHHCVPTTFWTRSISAPGKHHLNNCASCPSALQSSKGKTPLREQEEFAFVRTIILAEFFFEILVYVTETAGPFFFSPAWLGIPIFPSNEVNGKLSECASSRWLRMYICKYPAIAGMGHFVLQFTFLKFIIFVQLLFIIPCLDVANSAIYFTVSASSKRHILFCLQLSALPWAHAGGGGLPSPPPCSTLSTVSNPLKITDWTIHILSSCFPNRCLGN